MGNKIYASAAGLLIAGLLAWFSPAMAQAQSATTSNPGGSATSTTGGTSGFGTGTTSGSGSLTATGTPTGGVNAGYGGNSERTGTAALIALGAASAAAIISLRKTGWRSR